VKVVDVSFVSGSCSLLTSCLTLVKSFWVVQYFGGFVRKSHWLSESIRCGSRLFFRILIFHSSFSSERDYNSIALPPLLIYVIFTGQENYTPAREQW